MTIMLIKASSKGLIQIVGKATTVKILAPRKPQKILEEVF